MGLHYIRPPLLSPSPRRRDTVYMSSIRRGKENVALSFFWNIDLEAVAKFQEPALK